MIAKKLTRILLVLAILVSGCTLDVGPARYHSPRDPGPHYRITTYLDCSYGWCDVTYRYADRYNTGPGYVEIYYDGMYDVWWGGYVIDPWYADWYY